MTARAARFFVAGVFEVGDVVDLEAQDARKLLVVLRARDGDAVEIVDSSGRSYAALLRVVGERVRAQLETRIAAPAPLRLRVTLAQGIPKGQKMDFVIEKASEIGVAAIAPFTSARTIGDGTRDGKLERWRRLAKSAATQCGRSDVPAVEAPIDFAALLARVGTHDVTLVPWELAPPQPLHERLPSFLEGVRDVALVIGPEGGLTHDEAGELASAGAHLISLGSRILRTETAGLVACSILQYVSGDI